MPQDFEQSVKERIYLQNVSPRTVEWYRESFKWLGRYELTEQGLKDFVIGMRDAGLKPVSCNSRIRVRTPISNGLDWNSTSNAKRRGTGVRKETNHLAMPKITQSKFAQILAARTNKTVSETADFLDAFKSQVYELLNQGHVVELSGMGSSQLAIGIQERVTIRAPTTLSPFRS